MRDKEYDLAAQWISLADWPGSFDVRAIAAAWDMDASSETLQNDLSELQERGLIEYDQISARYTLNAVMQYVAKGLFRE